LEGVNDSDGLIFSFYFN